MAQEQKTTLIRLKIEHYKFLRESSSNSNRTISGQVNWVCRVYSNLEEEYHETYAKI